MTFPSKGWIPDHCLSKLSASLTDLLTVKFRVSPTCSAHTEGTKYQARKERRDNICLQKPPVQAGKPKHPSAPVQRTNREEVFAQHSKKCAPQNRCIWEKLRHHKDVWETVSSRSLPLYRWNQKLSTRFRTVCLRIDFPSHWTRPDIVSRRMWFSAQRQLMSYFTRKSFAHCMQR